MKLYAPALFSVLCLSGLSTFCQATKDTITTLSTNRTSPAIYKAPDGKLYKVKFIADPSEKKVSGPEDLTCGEDTYSGTDRASAKTSFGTGVKKTFATIAALVSSLPTDAVMKTKVTKKSPRSADEQKNVRLDHGIFLFAMKSESDNDYHVIIGDNKDPKKATLLNVEISGVPKKGNASIQKVRDFFEKNFVELCGTKYAAFTPAIPIVIEGSVFYDIDHAPGTVGPAGMRPKTAWEIHPIKSITLK